MYVPNRELARALWPYVTFTRRWYVMEPDGPNYSAYMKMLMLWNSVAPCDDTVAVAE